MLRYVILNQAILLLHAFRFPTKVVGMVEAENETQALGRVARWAAGLGREFVARWEGSVDGRLAKEARKLGAPTRVGTGSREGYAITAIADQMVFRPDWLEMIQPVVPERYIKTPADIVYPPSIPSRAVITPAALALRATSSEQWYGYGFCTGEILDQAGMSHKAQQNRQERKAARREELSRMGSNARRSAKAERQAAKEARRVMMARREACRAAFAKEEIDG